MSFVQNPPPNLLSLPNEILANICVYAVDKEPSKRGKDWLRAVRFTCKQLYTPATEELAKRFFRNPAVMLSRRSLQELVALCKHSIIGPYIQEIVFHHCRLDKKFLSTVEDRMGLFMIRKDLRAIVEAKRHVQWYFAKLEDEIRLEDSGDAKLFFEQAFGALRVYQKPIKLTTTTRKSLDVMFTYSEWRNDRPTSKDFISFSKSAYVQGSGLTFLPTIFEAAITAGTQIHNLEVRMDTTKSTAISYENVYPCWQTAQAVARLERLEVDLGIPFPDGAVEKTLVGIVVNAKGLMGVVFFSNPQYVRKSWSMACYMFRLVRVLESRALRHIWLRDIVLLSKGLLIMLKKHRGTLKEVNLSDVLLLGSWHEVLLGIRDELCLDKLVMINLSSANEYEFKADPNSAEIKSSLDGGVEFNGHEKVTSGTAKMLREWNRQ
jgi:hypothetical protein